MWSNRSPNDPIDRHESLAGNRGITPVLVSPNPLSPFTQRGRGILRRRDISWPFASIRVEPRLITVNVFGIETFTPEDAPAIEPMGRFIFGRGVRIHFQRGANATPDSVAFYTVFSARPLIAAIAAAGFHIGKSPLRPGPRGGAIPPA